MEPGTQGQVVGLFVGADPGGPMQPVDEVEAVAGRGLVGDRYLAGGDDHDPTEEITLFAREEVDAANETADVTIDAVDLRRNVMVAGVDLREPRSGALAVGDVVIDAIEANPPCAHLQRLAGKALLAPLAHGGGVRGRIRGGGTIRQGDAVRWLEDATG